MTRNLKILLIVGTLIIIVMLGILIFLNYQTNSSTNNTYVSEKGYIINEDSKYLEDDNISDGEKYLMLLSQISVENFGTNERGDSRPLKDLLNSSTAEFGITVNNRINQLSSSQNIVTKVDANTIKVRELTAQSALITMKAVTIDNNNETEEIRETQVTLTKEGEFWLIRDISF